MCDIREINASERVIFSNSSKVSIISREPKSRYYIIYMGRQIIKPQIRTLVDYDIVQVGVKK